MRYKLYSLLLILLISLASGCTREIDPWQGFIESPNDSNTKILADYIALNVSECGWGKESNATIYPEKYRGKTFELIRGGKSSSAEIGLSIIDCLDGGDLSELKVSLSQFFDKNPKEFLMILRERNIQVDLIASILTLNSPETLDKPRLQKELLTVRREALASHSDVLGSEKSIMIIDKLENILQLYDE